MTELELIVEQVKLVNADLDVAASAARGGSVVALAVAKARADVIEAVANAVALIRAYPEKSDEEDAGPGPKGSFAEADRAEPRYYESESALDSVPIVYAERRFGFQMEEEN